MSGPTRQTPTTEAYEIYFQNWKSFWKAIDQAGGRPDFVLDKVEDFLVTLATNHISISATTKPPTLAGVSKEWFEKSAEIEGDSEVGAGRPKFPDNTYRSEISPDLYLRCDNCANLVNVNKNTGHAYGCDYVYGRRGWRQIGSYDG
jgi:hypothetical protein